MTPISRRSKAAAKIIHESAILHFAPERFRFSCHAQHLQFFIRQFMWRHFLCGLTGLCRVPMLRNMFCFIAISQPRPACTVWKASRVDMINRRTLVVVVWWWWWWWCW